MKTQAIIILSTILSFNCSTLSMLKQRRDTQRPYITDTYLIPIRKLVTQEHVSPSTLQKQIATLMARNGIYNQMFTNATTAGLVVKQTATKDDPSAPYLVALTFNTPGTISWLKQEILKQKNNHTIAHALGYMMRKLVHYDTDPLATLESIFQLRMYLGEEEQEEFLYHKVKAVKRAHKLKKNDLVKFLMSH